MINSFTVFGVTFYPYSLLMIAGTFVTFGIFCWLTVRRHTDTGDENAFVIEMLVISIAAALPAAMFFDALFKIGETGKFVLKGATFYGGLLGALAFVPSVLCIKKQRKVSIYERLCDFAPAIPAGHFFGRIGCFLGGCCFGSPTENIFGVVFPEGSAPYAYYGCAVAIHPTQLYEAAALLALFFILFFLWKKHSISLYFILYGVARFTIEFFRADDRGAIFSANLSPAQIISLALIAAGIGIIIFK
ncbi:MAG: prolipoprotein diacylglyceryl transferase, partial [Clostridiales bacterium]|nr:prolipoprotein diacylglyceryl transferase [Clostridiales bacterium]